jgi:hypothetical protein
LLVMRLLSQEDVLGDIGGLGLLTYRLPLADFRASYGH